MGTPTPPPLIDAVECYCTSIKNCVPGFQGSSSTFHIPQTVHFRDPYSGVSGLASITVYLAYLSSWGTLFPSVSPHYRGPPTTLTVMLALVLVLGVCSCLCSRLVYSDIGHTAPSTVIPTIPSHLSSTQRLLSAIRVDPNGDLLPLG